MKKIFSIALILAAFNVHANDIKLSAEQKQAANKLTDISLQIMDWGKFASDILQNKNFSYPALSSRQQRCLNDTFATSKGYRQYQYERATNYVINRTPQQLQDDFAILNPNLVQLIHNRWQDLLKSKATAHNEEDLLDNSHLLIDAITFTQNAKFRDLRTLMGVSIEDEPQNFFDWSLKACQISVNDLRQE